MRNLPPDPEDMNAGRSKWAEDALLAFMIRTGTDAEDAIADLIADMRHLCDRQPEIYGDFDEQLARGNENYRQETLTDAEYQKL